MDHEDVPPVTTMPSLPAGLGNEKVYLFGGRHVCFKSARARLCLLVRNQSVLNAAHIGRSGSLSSHTHPARSLVGLRQ